MRHKVKSRNIYSKGRRAFTLIEIMVASVVMVVLVGLVLQITGEVLKVWNKSSGKLTANAEARIALELLTQDLETAVFRNNGLRWVEAETKTLSTIAGYQPQTVELILFSPALDRPQVDNSGAAIPGDICAVQYELVYQNSVDGTTAVAEDNMFALHRRLIDPMTTFDSLLGTGNQEDFSSWSDAQVTPSSNVDLDTYEGPSDPDHYLAGHIANFKIDFYYVDSSGNPQKVNSPVKFGGLDATVGPNAANVNARFPIAYAEVTLVVLSEEGTELLQNLDANRAGTGYVDDSDGTAADKVVREHGEVFTRRVNILARPL